MKRIMPAEVTGRQSRGQEKNDGET